MNYNRVRGRYGGGVRVADGYYLGRKYLKPDQQELLKRLSENLTGEDLATMNSILSEFALTEKQINRRLSVGSYGRRLMEWMKEQQQERYQQLLQEGDLFPILVEVQVEASQTKDKMVDEMLNDPEIKAMDWLERSKVITLQSDLIDQQIMREIVLIPR